MRSGSTRDSSTGSGDTAGQAQPPVAVQPGGACQGSPAFCGSAVVDLSLPEMRDVRGTMDFRVEGRDAAGNRGFASAGLKVTRWKWALDAAGNILGTPAVGNTGAIYVGTVVAGNGKLFSVSPEGLKRWEFLTGDVYGSPAVGEYSANDEYVYVAARNPGNVSAFYAVRGVVGSEQFRCTYGGANDFPAAVAVGMTQGAFGGLVETGVTLYDGTARVVGIRPGSTLGTECFEVSGGSIPLGVFGGSVVMKDQHLFYGTSDFRVTSYDLATGSNVPRPGWPQSTAFLARGLTLVGGTLYGGASHSDNPAQGSLFSIPTAGGSVSTLYPAAPVSRVFNLAIGSGSIAYFGAETSSSRELLTLSLTASGGPLARAGDVGTLRGAPVVAKNDGLFTLNTAGRLTAWTASTLAPLWNVDLPFSTGVVEASMTLDCRREASGRAVAGPGTLYVPVGSRLYAFLVDSPGLDPNAPWPKYQHDARNTGNPATPITNCP